MKQASIETEKITVNGIKCRRIMGFQNVLDLDALPEMYIKSGLSFYLESSQGGIQNESNFDGQKYDSRGIEKGTPLLVTDLPTGVLLPGLEDTVDPMIYVGDILREDTFQSLLVWLKRAGSRLAKIRKKEQESWSGKEVVTI